VDETTELPEAPTAELTADPFEPIGDDGAGGWNAGAVIGAVLAVVAVIGVGTALLLTSGERDELTPPDYGVAATADASPRDVVSSPCGLPVTATFSATISVTRGPVTVTYSWYDESTGQAGPQQQLDFPQSGPQEANVAEHRELPGPGSYGAALRITSPVEALSNRAVAVVGCDQGGAPGPGQLGPDGFSGTGGSGTGGSGGGGGAGGGGDGQQRSVDVPDVVGLSVSDARRALATARLSPHVIEIDGTGPAGTVISTDPPSGSRLPEGGRVTLRVDRGNLVELPDLLGSDVETARQALGAVGWEGRLTVDELPVSDPAQEGQVLQQSVPPGRPIDRNAPLSVSVGTLRGLSTTAAPG
jgi:hypothetical protein